MWSEEQIYAYRDAMIRVRNNSMIPAAQSEVEAAVEIITQLLVENAQLKDALALQGKEQPDVE